MSASGHVLNELARLHPADLASMLDGATAEQACQLFAQLDRVPAGRVLGRMNPGAAARLLSVMDSSEAAAVLEQAGPVNAAMCLTRVDLPQRSRLLQALPERTSSAVTHLLTYADETAGALMDPLVVHVFDDMTVDEARQTVCSHSKDVLYYLYVTNRRHQLVGVITLRELIAAEASSKLSSLMKPGPESIPAAITQLAAATHPGWQRYHAMPVVDGDDTLLGAIRYEAIRQLERKLGQAVKRPPVAETAEALAEFYSVGLLGMLRSLVPSGRDPRAERRDADV